jgi:hypothetical protein
VLCLGRWEVGFWGGGGLGCDVNPSRTIRGIVLVCIISIDSFPIKNDKTFDNHKHIRDASSRSHPHSVYLIRTWYQSKGNITIQAPLEVAGEV